MEKKSRKEKNEAIWWLVACRHRKVWLIAISPARLNEKCLVGLRRKGVRL
jgi:hypothetical protein